MIGQWATPTIERGRLGKAMTDMEAHIVIAEHLRDELRGIRETLADQRLLGGYYHRG